MKDRIWTILYMLLITAVATALMTGAKVLLQDRIRINEKLFENRAELYGLGVIPLAEKPSPEEVARLYEKCVKRSETDGHVLFHAYNPDDGSLSAIGVAFQGQGFWGTIRGILSADPDGTEIIGLYISSHQETPGLGARITEEEFLSKFKNRPIPEADADGNYPLWQPTDAITGATRTSESMEHILNSAARDLKERIAEAR